MTTDKKHYWERYFPQFLNHCDPAMQRLMDSATLVSLPAGEEVFFYGSLCENYLLLLEGRIKTQLISENGRELLLYHVQSGESCVLTTSCLLGGNRYPAEGITEQETKAFVITKSEFQLCIDQSIYFRQFVFNNFALRLSNIISRMEELMFLSIETRLSRSLLSQNELQIEMTHQALAAELGSAREVISRILKRFESNGWIKLARGTIEIIDQQALLDCSKQD